MKRTLKIALSVVLGAALVIPAIAQDAFPDTPENHWAYEALREMKNNGLLVGYPDGLFRGQRPASRYEMAVAIHATYKHLKNIADGLDGRINDLKRQVDGIRPGTSGVSQADFDNLKNALSQLQSQVGNMRAWGDDIANLKRLAATFERELSSMGVDVEALKKGMSDLADRVGALEKRKLPVDIHGDVNFFGIGGYSDSPEFGVTVDGRPTGWGRGSKSGLPVGATEDMSIFHEAAVTLSGTNDEGPKWGGTIVFGNMLEGFGNQSELWSGSPFNDSGSSDVYIQNAWVKFDTSLVGQNFGATIGRIEKKVGPYIFQRIDNTPYFANERWDNRHYSFDGADLSFKFGQANLDVFGGRTSNHRTTNGVDLQPLMAGGLSIDRMLGVTLNVPLTDQGDLNLAYLWLDSDNGSTSNGNRVNVFGGDVGFKFGGVKLSGGYSQSNLNYNTSTINDDDSAAWWVKAGISGSKWGLTGFYRTIEPNFSAPGDWGRLGWIYNPTDIKGYGAYAHYDLTDSVRLMALAEMYEGADTASSSLTSDDNVNRYMAGLGYKINGSWQFGLGYEQVDFELFGDPTARVKWWNLGFGYTMSNNASLNILWQISDFDNGGVGSSGFTTPWGASTAKGGLVTTQLSVRF